METNYLDLYVIDLPTSIYSELAKILDEDKTWKRVAALVPHFTSRDISELQEASHGYNNTSGYQFLTKIGCTLKVRELAKLLDLLQLESALMLLLPYEPVSISEQPIHYLEVVEGEDSHIILHCQATGFPYPQYQWNKFNNVKKTLEELITQQSSSLNISPVRLKHGGFYICRIYNQNGTDIFTEWTEVIVHPAPALLSYSDVTQEKLKITFHPQAPSEFIDIGSCITLKCDAEGKSPLTYSWYMNGEVIPDANDNKYTLINVQPENNNTSWRFQCKVSNADEHVMSKEAVINLRISNKTELYTAEDKVALLIGNSDYLILDQLHTPTKDILTLGNALLENKFKVLSFCDLTFMEMRSAVNMFTDFLDKGVFALFYYVGHGFSYQGQNYMLPVDAKKNYQLNETLCSEYVLKLMQEKKTALNVFFLDMCRQEPEGNIDRSRTFEDYKPEVVPNVIYFYATTKHCSAYEELNAENGIFMKHLKKFLNRPEPLSAVIELVKEELDKDALARNKQFPWSSGNCKYPFSLSNKICPKNQKQSEERRKMYDRLYSLPERHFTTLSSGYAILHFAFIEKLILNYISINVNICHQSSSEFQYDVNVLFINRGLKCQLVKSHAQPACAIKVCNVQKLKEPLRIILQIRKYCCKSSFIYDESPIDITLTVPLSQFWKSDAIVPVEQEEPEIPEENTEKKNVNDHNSIKVTDIGSSSQNHCSACNADCNEKCHENSTCYVNPSLEPQSSTKKDVDLSRTSNSSELHFLDVEDVSRHEEVLQLGKYGCSTCDNFVDDKKFG